ncbi:hypothetical protein ACIQZB_42555 [Streptomyces sp. NPDC097727]|uniref:hypothetical protein n=1 Tax=Streptomyces sp. NPDC097727 TaxID=3366092 RepID=UPI00380A91FB
MGKWRVSCEPLTPAAARICSLLVFCAPCSTGFGRAWSVQAGAGIAAAAALLALRPRHTP